MYPDVIDQAVDAGLSGLEHCAGIPSIVDGALWQNLHFPPERRTPERFALAKRLELNRLLHGLS